MRKTKSNIFITLIACSLLSCTRNPSAIPSDNQGPFENEHIHSFQSNYCEDDTNHWKECSCGEKGEISSHVYVNGICEVCGHKKPSEGLKFVDLGDYCGVDDLGTCTDQIVVIPANHNGKPVETIQEKAFINCYNLTNVIFPNTIHYIANNAFENCEKLDNIVISENVGSIGCSAFSGCIGLTNIELPTNLENIGGAAFYGCSGLTSITIPDKITSID